MAFQERPSRIKGFGQADSSRLDRRRNSSAGPNFLTIPTAGEVLADGTIIDLVRRDPEHRALHLLAWDGAKTKMASRIESCGRLYAPRTFDPTFLRAVRFPTHAEAYGSTHLLFSSLCEFAKTLGLPESITGPPSYFAISTWFADCLEQVPCLSLVGSNDRVAAVVLKFLHFVSRRPLHLVNLGAAGFCSLPMDLRPTLLLDQPELNGRLRKLLFVSNRRPCHFARNGQLVDLFCPKALYTRRPLSEPTLAGTTIPISLAAVHLGTASNHGAPERVASDLQARLLMYRLRNFYRVRDSRFDVPEFVPAVRGLAQSLGACIVDDTELQAGILPLLQELNEELRARRWTDFECVVIEAALLFCHEGKGVVYVGEIASAANVILERRGEQVELEARAFGEILGSLGLSREPRESRGYKILLTNAARERIHQLARDFGVPSLDDRVARCQHCVEILETKRES